MQNSEKLENRSFRKVGKETTFFAKRRRKKKTENNRKNYLRERSAVCKGNNANEGSSSEKEHKENALASGAEEGRD